MNCTQETYLKCLEAVAPQEVWAARQNGVYAATWHHKGGPIRTPTERERQVAALLDKHGEMTVAQIRTRLGTSTVAVENIMRALKYKKLVTSQRRQVGNNERVFWGLVE